MLGFGIAGGPTWHEKKPERIASLHVRLSPFAESFRYIVGY